MKFVIFTPVYLNLKFKVKAVAFLSYAFGIFFEFFFFLTSATMFSKIFDIARLSMAIANEIMSLMK